MKRKQGKLSLKKWIENKITKSGKPLKIKKAKVYENDSLIIIKFNPSYMTIETKKLSHYFLDEPAQENEIYDLEHLPESGLSYHGIIEEFYIEYNVTEDNFFILCIVKSKDEKSNRDFEICNFTEEEIATILNIDINKKNIIDFNPELLLGEDVEVTLVKPIPFIPITENISYKKTGSIDKIIEAVPNNVKILD